jgi:hypothetical protein
MEWRWLISKKFSSLPLTICAHITDIQVTYSTGTRTDVLLIVQKRCPCRPLCMGFEINSFKSVRKIIKRRFEGLKVRSQVHGLLLMF